MKTTTRQKVRLHLTQFERQTIARAISYRLNFLVWTSNKFPDDAGEIAKLQELSNLFKYNPKRDEGRP